MTDDLHGRYSPHRSDSFTPSRQLSVLMTLFGPLAIMALSSASGICEASDPLAARVYQHTSAKGQVSSAILLKAGELSKGVPIRQHIVVVDTSASQVGEHRRQSLNVLESLLKSLPEDDQVRLFAADLQAEPLDQGFHGAHSNEVADSIELLKMRVPLGATNLEGVLRTAMKAATDAPTDITYIGDGMSTADLLEIPELRGLVADLRQRKMPVHAFGVGAQRNMQLLGVLAHHTGGYVSFDTVVIDASDEKAVKAEKTKSAKLAGDIARVRRSAAERAAEQGKALATALNAPVFFSKEIHLNSEGALLLPMEGLPVRTDRETIYLLRGSVPAALRLTLTNDAGDVLEWKCAAAVEQPGATFLPLLIGQLEASQGLTNPLAGLTLYLYAQSDFSDNLTAMAQRGMQALQLNDLKQANQISQMVSDAEPQNEAGVILKRSLERLKSQPGKASTPGNAQKPIPGTNSGDAAPQKKK